MCPSRWDDRTNLPPAVVILELVHRTIVATSARRYGAVIASSTLHWGVVATSAVVVPSLVDGRIVATPAVVVLLLEHGLFEDDDRAQEITLYRNTIVVSLG